MIKSLINCFLFVAVFSISEIGNAQTDSTNTVKQDSVLEAQSNQSTSLLEIADSVKLADSLEQMSIQKEIDKLRSNDLKKKAQLQARLDSLKHEKQLKEEITKRKIDSLKANTKGVPVVLYEDTLFYIYSKIGPFTPRERAQSIQNKLTKLVENKGYNGSRLIVFDADDSQEIMHADVIILTLTKEDSFWLDGDPNEIANAYVESINATITEYQESNGILQTVLRLIALLLVIIIFSLMVKYLNKGFTRFNDWVKNKLEHYLTGIKIKEYEIITATTEMDILNWLLKILKWALIVFTVYLSLPIIFSIFPSTEGISRKLISYVTDPLLSFIKAIVGYIPEMITIMVIVAITRYVVQILKFMAEQIESGKLEFPGFYSDWAKPTFNLLRVLLYAFSFVMIFPYLPGSDSPVFRGVSVFLGVLFSLGSSSAIGNLVAGLVITYMRPFKIGDRVKIGEVTGEIIEKTMLVTRLRTIKNEDITIPNASILNGHTINYSTPSEETQGLILHTTVTLGYDVPWKLVHEVLIAAAIKIEEVKKKPKPFVLQTSLDDFYVSYQVNLYTKFPEKSAVIYSNLHANIQDGCNEAGIEILSPHYRAARDGNMTSIPENYLPKDYEAPSFSVKQKKEN